MERRMKRAKPSERQPEKNPAKKMAKNMSIFVFITCLVAILVVFLFFQHKNRDKSGLATNGSTGTEVERLAKKDLDDGYPDTPTEVLKLFGRYNQCMYNTGLSDEQFDVLIDQLRKMYSTTLLEQNPLEEHKKNMKEEIEAFHSSNTSIVNYTVGKSGSVDYRTINGQSCAYVQMAYFLKENNKAPKSYKSYQNYVLVKENDDWKILAFKKEDAQGTEQK